jgi:ERCC4-type nuclease
MADRGSRTYLVSDTRERHVHGFIETLFGAAGVGHVIAQINTGDYLVCRRFAGGQPEILAVLERKTLKDFAASFKDGRYLNRNKMMDLRDETGCQLYFFVEGAAFPRPARKIARIPYSSILAAMTNLMIRDGIHVVQTENELGTAQRLLDFVRGFNKIDVPFKHPVVACLAAKQMLGASGGGQASEMPAADRRGVPEIVMGLIAKDDGLLAAEMWARLAGISLSTARVLAAALTVADLVGGRVTDADLAALRTAGGRQLAKKGRATLRALKRGDRKTEIKVLSGVPGISPAMAAQVLPASGPSLSDLLAREPAGIAAAPIRQKGRVVRLGAARAERVHRLMNWRRAVPARDAVSEDRPPHRVAPGDVIADDEFDDLVGGLGA